MAGINYAEERAYWYLRLNGFLLLTDYVVHKSPNESFYKNPIENRRDVDIIGIRLEHVWEEVGGRSDDFDGELLEQCGISQSFNDFCKPFAVICEVKSGENFDKNRINLEMSEKNLQTKTVIEAALRRIGICPSSKIEECIEKLSTSNYADMENFLVAKILFSKETTCKCEKYCRINLDYARMFILNRMLKYISEKNASRMFFDSFQLQDNIDLINAMNEKLGPKETMEIIKKIGQKDL